MADNAIYEPCSRLSYNAKAVLQWQLIVSLFFFFQPVDEFKCFDVD